MCSLDDQCQPLAPFPRPNLTSGPMQPTREIVSASVASRRLAFFLVRNSKEVLHMQLPIVSLMLITMNRTTSMISVGKNNGNGAAWSIILRILNLLVVEQTFIYC